MHEYHLEETLPSHDQVDAICIGPRLINRNTLETISHLVERLPEEYTEGAIEVENQSASKRWRFTLRTQDTTLVSSETFNSKQEALLGLKTWLSGERFAAVLETDLKNEMKALPLRDALDKARELGCVHLVVTHGPDHSYVIHGFLKGQPYKEVAIH